jgi:trans-2,3-dihydro-3-hydroxyanthranilate isomerase
MTSASRADWNLYAWEGPDAASRYVVVDVFTDTPLEGNQLAVFPDADQFSSGQMQSLAREMKFSETVFCLSPQGEGDTRVRIFTPAQELAFAGHAVLGCAFVVGIALKRDGVRLETGLGVIPVELERQNGRPVFGRMQQVIPDWYSYDREPELLMALGVERSGLPVEAYPNGPLHVYVELESQAAVAELKPDMRALAELPVAANCFAGDGTEWKTRMFAPAGGVTEDPATGSAAGPLAVHLSRHGRIAFGEQIEIRQGAEIGRPSVLYACATGSPDRIDRIEVGGSAVIVARGEFRIS